MKHLRVPPPSGSVPADLRAGGLRGLTSESITIEAAAEDRSMCLGEASRATCRSFFTRFSASEDVESMKCGHHACNRHWPWPRDVNDLTEHPPNCHHQVDPSTQDTVVVYQNPRKPLPINIFRRFRFTWNPTIDIPGCGAVPLMKHRMVTHIEYNQQRGRVFYDTDKQESDDNGFALLITLNSWWIALFSGVLRVAFGVMDFNSNFMFCAALFSDQVLAQVPFASRVSFAVCWVLTVICAVCAAIMHARRGWSIRTHWKVGDVVTDMCAYDRARTFIALTTLIFFDVAKEVRDIVVLLHPLKSVQPYAAFKAQGHRGYFLGYPSEHLYRVESHAGQKWGKLFVLLGRTWIFIWKLYMLIDLQIRDPDASRSFTLAASILCSSFSTALEWKDWAYLLYDRRMVWKMLHARIQDPALSKMERDSAQKLMVLHFGHGYQAWSPDEDSRCPRCGHNLPNPEGDEEAGSVVSNTLDSGAAQAPECSDDDHDRPLLSAHRHSDAEGASPRTPVGAHTEELTGLLSKTRDVNIVIRDLGAPDLNTVNHSFGAPDGAKQAPECSDDDHDGPLLSAHRHSDAEGASPHSPVGAHTEELTGLLSKTRDVNLVIRDLGASDLNTVNHDFGAPDGAKQESQQGVFASWLEASEAAPFLKPAVDHSIEACTQSLTSPFFRPAVDLSGARRQTCHASFEPGGCPAAPGNQHNMKDPIVHPRSDAAVTRCESSMHHGFMQPSAYSSSAAFQPSMERPPGRPPKSILNSLGLEADARERLQFVDLVSTL